ncbi:hypothetical protein DFJ74DRAFT_215662 [Hyaloraphidium curvatum]|nr:hypothetical protein DFJ74DRAFT_215662 [Hyaloraphidium curvatum]
MVRTQILADLLMPASVVLLVFFALHVSFQRTDSLHTIGHSILQRPLNSSAHVGHLGFFPFPVDENSTFLRDFRRLNELPSTPAGTVIFKGNKQGLGNNILQFVSALTLSVVLRRSFRYAWNGAAELADLSDIVNLPASIRWPANEPLPSAQCEWTLSIYAPPEQSPKDGCWNALSCANFTSDPLLSKCPNLAISSNLYYIASLAENPNVKPLLESYFPATNSIIGHLSAAFLAPTGAVQQHIREQQEKLLGSMDQWDTSAILGVHLRVVYVKDTVAAADCIRRTFLEAGTWNNRLLHLNVSLQASMENAPSLRAQTVHTAWEEILILSRLQTKILTMSESTFSHVVYALSSPTSTVYSVENCSLYTSNKRHFRIWMPPRSCPSQPGMNHSLTDCVGVYKLRR